MSRTLLYPTLALSALLVACQPAVEAPLPARAVRTLVVGVTDVSPSYELAGEIKARVESRLGFQVGGRMASRSVDLGQRVHKGEVLASIDQRDLTLAMQAAQARMESAKADLTLAQSERDRFAELRRQGFVPDNALDGKEAALSAAKSRFDEARAQLEMQGNQKAYAVLRADADGVVVGVDADAGEVVGIGQPVIRIAHDGAREVEVVFPEDKLLLAKSAQAEAALWANPDRHFSASLRELSASADPVTRTFVARFSVAGEPADVQLGQTAMIKLRVPHQKAVLLPTTALLEHQGTTQVWLYDAEKNAVFRHSVEMLGVEGNSILVSGLQPGQVVVTAGVHVLMDGQKVTLLASGDKKDASASPSVQ